MENVLGGDVEVDDVDVEGLLVDDVEWGYLKMLLM